MEKVMHPKWIAVALLLGAFALPAFACRPFGSYEFVEDAQGGIWFTEGDNNAISRLAPDGSVKAHPLPTRHAEPISLAEGRNGEIWFSEAQGRRIGRLDADGRITEFPVTNGHPAHIVVDRAGEAWYTQMSGHENDSVAPTTHSAHIGTIAKVGRVDAQGRTHDYPLDQGWPTSIALDGRDRVLVTVLIPGGKSGTPTGRLMRLSRDGEWLEQTAWNNSCPGNLVADGKGGVAYSDHCRGVFGRVDVDGRLAEHRLPSDTYVQQLSAAADGTFWFTGDPKSRLGRIGPDGKVSYLHRPENGDQTMAVLATRSGDIVFSEFYNYNINRLKKTGEYVEHLVAIDERKDSKEVRDDDACRIEFAARIASKGEMDRKRAEEVKNGRFRPDGHGTEKLVEQKCLLCHDARRLLLSRRSDWTPSLTRMHDYRSLRGVQALTPEETVRLVGYFNENYGLK
jgi:streptogramin lyase